MTICSSSLGFNCSSSSSSCFDRNQALNIETNRKTYISIYSHLPKLLDWEVVGEQPFIVFIFHTRMSMGANGQLAVQRLCVSSNSNSTSLTKNDLYNYR
ncbi:hypothetical protein PanWU01x14_265050 [Parasponia andersonii]|uniref:Uncharacterized protein n=1 Tax=Parasponia andersonii TaxID=3476 RepID=A0A2P5B786_PARAD|nr:hypothetical protein PanWU01x14_265050 [Parasponia andersonii]